MTVAFAIVALAVLVVAGGRMWRTQRRGRLDEKQARALETLGRLAGEAPRAGTGRGGAEGDGPSPPGPDQRAGTVLLRSGRDRPELPHPAPPPPPSAPSPPAGSGRGLFFDDLNPPPVEAAAPAPPGPAAPAHQEPAASERGSRWPLPGGLLPRAVEVLTVVVVLAAGALVGLLLDGTGGHGYRSAAPPSSAAHHQPRTAPASSRPGTTTSSPAATTTLPPSPAAASATAPVLVSVSPPSGHAGQVLTLVGHQLFSPDGLIKVTFGSSSASISCTTQTTCAITVPPAAAGTVPGAAIPVKVVTEGGASNALTFRYRRS